MSWGLFKEKKGLVFKGHNLVIMFLCAPPPELSSVIFF